MQYILKNNPEIVDLYCIIAFLYAKSGNNEEAIENYKIALNNANNLTISVDEVKRELNKLL